jgi:hypothetical protein
MCCPKIERRMIGDFLRAGRAPREKIARAWVVRRRDRGDVAMNHAAELPAEISRLEQDLEGVLADRDHWREEREREARCQLTRRLAELLRK